MYQLAQNHEFTVNGGGVIWPQIIWLLRESSLLTMSKDIPSNLWCTDFLETKLQPSIAKFTEFTENVSEIKTVRLSQWKREQLAFILSFAYIILIMDSYFVY